MDAQHLHMIIVNRQEWGDAAYQRCRKILLRELALPGQRNDPGEKEGYDLAMALGEEVKFMLLVRARKHGLTEESSADHLTAAFFIESLNHISTEQLGAAFYTTTRERYQG